MSRFTVFGASGFVGSHLVRSLEQAGHTVAAIGRTNFPQRGAELGHCIYSIGLTANFRTDLAAAVHAHACLLAEVLESYQFESFLYLSSTRVYLGAACTSEGSSLTVDPSAVDQVYNLSKLTGEALCLAQPGGTMRVARLSNVLGPGMAPVNFVPALVDEAHRKSHVTIRTSEKSSKDYVDIADICALIQCIALRGRSRIYNLASGTNISNKTIARLIERNLRASVSFAENAPTVVFPSIDVRVIRAEFGFSALPFEQSFARVLDGTVGEK